MRRRKEGEKEGGRKKRGFLRILSWAGHLMSLDKCSWLPRSSFICLLQLFATPALEP
jgi:hypothetical protein